MAAQEHDRDEATGFEVDRHVEDQPPREDLLDPDEIELEEDDDLDVEDVNVPERTGDPERLADPEELPESQGADIVTSERLAEDDGDRPPLHDEPPFDEEE